MSRADPTHRSRYSKASPPAIPPYVPGSSVTYLLDVPASSAVTISYWQVENLKEAMRVCQFLLPFVIKYSLVYQKVQSSTGSIVKAE
jgi:hypothetical protein